MPQSSSAPTEVLIIGAGPVGLFLANECVRRGLRCRIVEAHSGQSAHSKALAIFPRTLEIFDMAGLAQRFLDVANRVQSVAVMSHDRNLAHIQFEPDHTPYPFVAMVPQNITEGILAEALQRNGANVEYDTQFISLEPRTDSVSVIVERFGIQEKIVTAFVVGCDGARSAVRTSLGITLDGGEYDMPFMLADIETNQALSSHEMQLCSSNHGPLAIFPISPTRRRIVATIDQPEGDAPTLELAQKLLAERGPKAIQALALHWSSYFRIHHRHASRLRVGRVFLAGDAAHIHSPFGGQGMNTGLHDVWNLVWKLELSFRENASDLLLDSYSEERLPVIKDVIETTDRLTKVLGTPNALAQFLRDSLIPVVSHISAFRHAMVERLSGLGIAYAGTIIHSSGKRAFEEIMRGGQLSRARFLLFFPQDIPSSFHESARSLASAFKGMLLVQSSQAPDIRLVRPDGYVAFSQSGNEGEAIHVIQSLLMKMMGEPHSDLDKTGTGLLAERRQ